MLGSALIYAPSLYLLSRFWGNHGIWAALFVLMIARSVFLSMAWPGLKDAVATRGTIDHPQPRPTL
jgi:multidrug resistance protein, MATE family